MSLCALRVAMAEAPAKQLPQAPVLIGPTIEPVMKTLVNAVFPLHVRNQARYIQVLLPALLSYWFSCRQTNSYIFKVISTTEYNKRKELVALPMLMFGIHLIVHEDYTFQVTKTETKTTNGMAKRADVDWYEEEIYSRLPYAKALLPLILCSYNLLTQNNIPEAPEERQYISNHYDPFEAGYRVLSYHSFPLILPFYRFGSTSYLTPPHKNTLRETKRGGYLEEHTVRVAKKLDLQREAFCVPYQSHAHAQRSQNGRLRRALKRREVQRGEGVDEYFRAGGEGYGGRKVPFFTGHVHCC